ncbi:hypothetical protein FRC00_001250, partial [Tulasnella sp. 408]
LNILVNSSCRAIITDFGSAREIIAPDSGTINEESGQPPTTGQPCTPIHVAAAGNKLTLTGAAWSLRWASPEVVNGKRPSLSSDIWAAAWVCWEPAIPPSGGNRSGSKEWPAQILIQKGWMHYQHSDYNKAALLLQQALHLAESADDHVTTADASSRLGSVYRAQFKFIEAEESYIRAKNLYTRIGDVKGRANASNSLGELYRRKSKYTQAEELFTEAQEVYSRIGEERGLANALRGLGDVYRGQSKYTHAEKSLAQAEEIYARIGGDLGRAGALKGLGKVYLRQSKYTEAEQSFNRAQELYARIGNERIQAGTLRELGDVYRLQSKFAQTEESYIQAREIYASIGSDRGQAKTLKCIGDLRRSQGRDVEATSSYCEARDLYVKIGYTEGAEVISETLAALLPDPKSSITSPQGS